MEDNYTIEKRVDHDDKNISNTITNEDDAESVDEKEQIINSYVLNNKNDNKNDDDDYDFGKCCIQ